METYFQMKERQQKEMDAFPLGAAFSRVQFKEMMEGWGLTTDDTDKILSVGAGCFIQKKDKAAFLSMFSRFDKEKEQGFKDDEFLYSAFRYEFDNHECYYTGNPSPALRSLGFSRKKIETNERLNRIYKLAWKDGLKSYNEKK